MIHQNTMLAQELSTSNAQMVRSTLAIVLNQDLHVSHEDVTLFREPDLASPQDQERGTEQQQRGPVLLQLGHVYRSMYMMRVMSPWLGMVMTLSCSYQVPP